MILLQSEWEDDSHLQESSRLPSYYDACASAPYLQRFSPTQVAGSSSGPPANPSSPLPRHFNPVVYTFAQNSFNSMMLSADPQQSPLCYHVSVQMNCFIPSSYITTVRRGNSEDGEMVGSFEMGISQKRSTVTIDNTEKLAGIVLSKTGGKSKHIWQWRWHTNSRLHLSWLCDSPVRYCYLSHHVGTSKAVLLASFTPHSLTPRADGHPSPPATLKVFPEGQRYADHIVMSALILERKRLTPDGDKALRSLFN